MVKILSGIGVRDQIKTDLIDKIKKLSFKPKLVILQVGKRDDSNIYIRNKKRFGEEIGVLVEIVNLENTVSELEVIGIIEKLNNDSSVNGIILQLPLPEHLQKNILNKIDSKKDIDALTEENKNKLYKENKLDILPATARAILNILDFYKIDFFNKKITVLGRSELVGKPTSKALEIVGAKVSIIHSKTENPEIICRDSEIIISAVGKANLVTTNHINKTGNQIVIDVGINKIEGKIVGDVDFDSVSKIVSAITPVPGGVGPVTVASLFQNLLNMLE